MAEGAYKEDSPIRGHIYNLVNSIEPYDALEQPHKHKNVKSYFNKKLKT